MQLLAIFDDTESAATALHKMDGVKREVFSAEPIHPPPVPNNLLSAAVLGGLGGSVAGAGLAVWVFYIVNLRTGHMEMITLAPIGIILFGVAALASIAAVLFELLHEAGLFSTKLTLPESVRAEVTRGAVAVIAADASEETKRYLQSQGARTEWLS